MEIKSIAISPEIQQRLETIKSKIPPDILATLETLHENGVYIGVHGGGITHELGPNSDIDLAIIPSEFSPNFIVELLSQVYSDGRRSPIPLEELTQLIQVYTPEVDYISLKVPTGGNPLSLHIENPDFRQRYTKRKVSKELRIPPKSSGLSKYLDVAITKNKNIFPIEITAAQLPIMSLNGTAAVLNFIHTSTIACFNQISPNLTPTIFISSEFPNTKAFILGLETNKAISEVGLSGNISPHAITPLQEAFILLSQFLKIPVKKAGMLYTEAYSYLLYRRKSVVRSPQELIQTLPALRAALEHAESL
ncbi:hypothetical protein [Persephonella sp.]